MRRTHISKLLIAAAGLLLAVAACTEQSENAPIVRTTTIRIVHGPELRSYLSSMKEQFYLSNPVMKDGTKIIVELIAELGVPAARRIASGEIKAEGWLAPSSTLVSVANSMVKNLGSTQGDCVQLFSSPVVLAIPPSLTDAIGAHDQQFDWDRVMSSRTAQGDAAGITIRYNHASPQASVSGLSALVQLTTFAAGLEPGNEIEWNETLANKLREYESQVSQYSLSESYLLERTSQAIPKRIRFTLTTEQQVILFNQHHGRGSPPLAALYPRRGAVWQDYTLCGSSADWMTPAQREGIKAFQSFLATDKAQRAASEHGFRPSISRKVDPDVLGPKVGVNISLPAASFPPPSAALMGTLLNTWEDLIHPIAIVLAIDNSGSMEGDYLRGVKDAAREFIARLPAHTKAALVSYSGEARLMAPFTDDMGQIIPVIDQLLAQGGSAAYDGLRFAVETVSAPELDEYRRAVVFITDGEGKNSEMSQSALESYLDKKIGAQDLNIMIVPIKREDSNYRDFAEISRNADAVFHESTIGDLQVLLQDLLKNL